MSKAMDSSRQKGFRWGRARLDLARRRRSELRLKWWGRLALLLAAAALLALTWSVASRAVFALYEHYLLVEVDPGSYAAGSEEAWLRETLRANVPEASGRRARRELYALVSDGAAFEVADAIAALPDGGSGRTLMPALASDHLDLYMKGQLSPLTAISGGFAAALLADADGYRLVPRDGGGFAAALEPFRERYRELAGRLDEEAARQESAAERVARAGSGESSSDSESGGVTAEDYRQRAVELRQEAAAVRERSELPDLAVVADPEFPSVLVAAAGGMFKAEAVAEGELRLGVIRAPTGSGGIEAGAWTLLVNPLPESWRSLSDRQIGWIESFAASGQVESRFNWRFFTSGNSREAELAGILGAVTGSFWTMLVTLLLACPVGVFAALYLEEFAPRNRVTDFIEVNINNLAAVPSIVFGLLGLAAFIQFFGLPRSVPLVGGMVLALMTLPTVIIASRASIRAVPGSIRDAALGVGASKVQTVFHHVLPLALPGILTGAIIGMAQALGETAPLLLIGMVAFIVGTSSGVLEPSSALPVQIFQWSDFPEAAFSNKAALAILALILFLIAMNALAVYLRHRFERRW